MNKTILMVLAVIVALLAGWLVLSVAMETRTTEPVSQNPVTATGPEVKSPSSVDIQVTVVDETVEPSSDITVEVTP